MTLAQYVELIEIVSNPILTPTFLNHRNDLYRGLCRRFSVPAKRRHIFWDSPVSSRESMDCDYPRRFVGHDRGNYPMVFERLLYIMFDQNVFDRMN